MSLLFSESDGEFKLREPNLEALVAAPAVTGAVGLELLKPKERQRAAPVQLGAGNEALTFSLQSQGGSLLKPEGPDKAVKSDPPPDVEMRDGFLKFASKGTSIGQLALGQWAPNTYANVALPLQVTSVFLNGASAASLWQQQGLTWKSATATAAAGADAFALAGMVFPALKDYTVGAKICVLAFSALSGAHDAVSGARRWYLAAKRDDEETPWS